MLAAVSLAAGDLNVVGTGIASDNISISSSGGVVTINDPDNAVTANSAWVTQVDTNTVNVTSAAITGELNVDTGFGDDAVTVSNLDLPAASLTVDESAESFTVTPNAVVSAIDGLSVTADTVSIGAGATLSTRQTPGDLLNGASSGDSSDISISGESINVLNGARLLAHVEDGSSFDAGDVTITATNTSERLFESPIAFTSQDATLTATNATIRGHDVSLTGDAADIHSPSELAEFVDDFVGQLKSLVEQLPGVDIPTFDGLSLSLAFRGSSSIVNVNGGVIAADGDIAITSDSTAESDIEATAVASPEIPIGVAIGFTRSAIDSERR